MNRKQGAEQGKVNMGRFNEQKAVSGTGKSEYGKVQ